MGNRFFAICNCCSCCCGGIKIQNMFADGFLPYSHVAPSGYVADVGEDCTACGECEALCQFNAISLSEEAEKAAVDFDKCMGCGVCESICPVDAVTLRIEPKKGGILDLDALKRLE